MCSALETEGDVKELEDLYKAFFSGQEIGESEEPLDIPIQISTTMQDVSTEGLGVELVCCLSSKALELQLGFQDARPPTFNPFCDSNRLNPWDHQQLQVLSPKEHDDLECLSLHWHQLCVVLATVQKIFSPH
jgi:hypothetical protein